MAMACALILALGALVPYGALAVEGGSKAEWANLNHHQDALVLATDVDLQKANDALKARMKAIESELSADAEKQMQAIDMMVQDEADKLKAAAHAILGDSISRLSALQVQAQRVRVSVHHGVLGDAAHKGVFGKCCCWKAQGTAQCNWINLGGLNGRQARECPRDTIDYLDKPEVPTAEALDLLADACAVSDGWQLHAGSTRLNFAVVDDPLVKEAYAAIDDIGKVDLRQS